MEHLVILNFGHGNWETGFPSVTAQILLGQEPEEKQFQNQSIPPLQSTGFLPGCPQLAQDYEQWQQLYAALYGDRQNWRRRRAVPEFEFEEAGLTNVSSTTFFQLCISLQQRLNSWLDTPSFRPIDRQLRTILSPSDCVRIMVVSQEQRLLRLPWSLWNFLEDYPRAEIAVSPPDYGRSLKTKPDHISNRVKILAVLGSAQDIDISTDRQVLEALPDVDLTLLTEPSWESLSQHLWQAGWDILFFAGHSSSEEQGFLQINETEQITIVQLKYALKRSIETGLQLAILNSCDGLGLAWDLTDLQIPQVIVMREPVPDRVAQEFLKHFLTGFSNHQTLYLAVREAREKLQSLEAQFGCASWLPVIVQNPAEHPPTWRSLMQNSEQDSGFLSPNHQKSDNLKLKGHRESSKVARTPENPTSSSPPSSTQCTDHARTSRFHSWRSKTFRTTLGAITTTGLLMVLRWFGAMAPLELWAFDQLLQLRPHEGTDSRLLVVTIDEADIQAQTNAERPISLSDESLQTLLSFLTQAQASVVGIDLYRDFSIGEEIHLLSEQLKKQQIIGICKGRDPLIDPTGIAPPPDMTSSQIGFSDFLTDSDGVLRRQIISMTPDPTSPCTTSYSFASQIVFNYLGQQGIEAQFTAEGHLQLGSQVFPRLRSNSGGYSNIDARGNQILLHYRSLDHPDAIAPQVSLREVLQGKLNPEAVRDRIVLIGVTAPSQGDFWATPYGSGPLEEVPGVFIHAQMISQLLGATLNRRAILWVWPQAVDGIWILTWALVGGAMGTVLQFRQTSRRPIQLILLWSSGVAAVGGLSFLLLLYGGWAPLIPAIAALLLRGIPSSLSNQSSHGHPKIEST